MKYVPLDLQTACIVLLTDASFANAKGLKSQSGYVIYLVDGQGKANIVHYGPNRFKRISRKVMAAEVHGLVLSFDYAYILRDLVSEIIGGKVTIEAFVDSKTLFNVVAKDGATSERRL